MSDITLIWLNIYFRILLSDMHIYFVSFAVIPDVDCTFQCWLQSVTHVPLSAEAPCTSLKECSVIDYISYLKTDKLWQLLYSGIKVEFITWLYWWWFPVTTYTCILVFIDLHSTLIVFTVELHVHCSAMCFHFGLNMFTCTLFIMLKALSSSLSSLLHQNVKQ